MTFGHSKCLTNWVSYRPLTAHFCFTAPLEFLISPKGAVPPTLGTTGLVALQLRNVGQLMTRSARDGNLKTAESAGLRPSLTPRDVKARMVSDGFIKPSAIIVTQHDDSAASISKSADDSRSETEEKDFSDVESFSFFLTESEAEHQLHAGGSLLRLSSYNRVLI